MSGRKNTLLKYAIINGGDGSTSLTSTVTNIQHMDNIGIQVRLTGSTAGTFSVQVSADHAEDTQGNVTVAGNWITLTTATVVAGSPADTFFNLNGLAAPWIRLIYTRTSGTGTVNAYITGKML